MLGLGTGLSALRSSQQAMDVIANNIANANTPGYHRQVVDQVSTQPVYLRNHWLGTGAEISHINQIASQVVESALTTNISDSSRVDQSLQIARQIESQLSPSFGSLQERFQLFFDEVQQLQARPDDSTQRRVLLDTSVSIANEFNSLSDSVDRLQGDQRQQIDNEVRLLNDQLVQLAGLNHQITQAQARGTQPNTLLDAHQQLVNTISESIDVTVIREENGFRYQFANDRVSLSNQPFQIAAHHGKDGSVSFTRPESDRTLDFVSGRLAGLQQSQNELLPNFERNLDQVASAFIHSVNTVQSTGIGAHWPMSQLTADRIVADPLVPLADLDLPFDISSGDLVLSVRDSNGIREQHRLTIDASVQSLQDVADEISSVPHVQAVIDSKTNTFSIIAEPGYGFDFAGQLPTQPNRSAMVGDAPIHFSGVPQSSENRQLFFEVSGTGLVGASGDLELFVLDEDGNTLGRHNLGNGFQPGSSIELEPGINISIDAGLLADGDSFSVVLAGNTDQAGLLPGLGLNSFFSGTVAGDISVSENLLDDPELIASGLTEYSGDGGNLTRMLDLRIEETVDGLLSFEDHVATMTSEIAIEVSSLSFLQSDLSSLQNALIQERESISGVDPNEEMVHMLQYQRSFQAAARVITTIDATLNELMNMIR